MHDAIVLDGRAVSQDETRMSDWLAHLRTCDLSSNTQFPFREGLRSIALSVCTLN